MLRTKKEIKNWLDKQEITNYTINDDLSVDADGNVNLFSKNLTEIPVKFNKVNGYFACSCNKLTSLEGSPKKIFNGYFDCSYNQLTLLKGSPEKVLGDFYCTHNSLTSLFGSPKEVLGDFWCNNNQLTSLKYLPEILGRLVCDEESKNTIEYKRWFIYYKLKQMV